MDWRKGLILIPLTVFLFTGCDNIPFFKKPNKEAAKPAAAAGPNTVALIGNFAISSVDLNKAVEDYNALAAAQGMNQLKIDGRDKKIAYLRKDVVRNYMLYQEALDRGLDKREDIAGDIESARRDILVRELVREELNKINVSDQELKDFYDKNKEMLQEPEQRNLSEIVTNTEDEAKLVYIELLKGGDFTALSKQYSKSPKAVEGGNLGMTGLDPDPKKRVRFDKFYEVAFAPSLEAGGISNIFKGPDGFYIVKVESVKKSEVKPLAELKDNIKSWLLFEKQQNAISELADKLKKQIKVEIFEEKVD
ncbi:MAG: peptidyl-prolyl cis-trans isomerase [Candidatus Omnitrophota bacterium]|nr:peptidyl-prolyl cis-trans isomerase [Candidatus Omnitrophota bacterium]